VASEKHERDDAMGMRNMSGAARQLVVAAMLCCFASTAWPQTKPAADEAKRWAEQASRLALAEARAYDVRLGGQDGERLKLLEQPVLKWSNTYEASVYGSAFVWTRAGRPEVIGCIFKFYTTKVSFDVELHSLATGPLTAVKDGVVVWQPSAAGTSLKPVADAPPPAKTAAGRLVQMRELARNFSADLTAVIEPKTKHHLRLLPQPLLRYSGDGRELKELRDGALFAFARETDPDVVLMLEARGEEAPRWEYALARMHVGALSAAYGGKEIWSVEEMKHPYGRKTGPYTLFQNVAEPKSAAEPKKVD
jgi:hypothetical protein